MKSIVNHIFFEMLYEYSNLFKGADDELNQIRNIYFIVNQIMIFMYTQENLFFQFKNRYIQLISGTSEFNY